MCSKRTLRRKYLRGLAPNARVAIKCLRLGKILKQAQIPRTHIHSTHPTTRATAAGVSGLRAKEPDKER